MTNAPPAALFRRLTTGVYVIGVAHGGRANAFTAAWLTQVSFDPLLLALSINPEHASYSLLEASGAFTVSVLEAGQHDLARHFGCQSGCNADKLAGVRWRGGPTGAPILLDAVSCFDCRVVGRLAAGDHELVVGRVAGGEILAPKAEPLGYRETGNLDGSEALYPATFPPIQSDGEHQAS
jgi:flavin reductase (DIM6/NTAB) family NADH-FMN oxidoreductase RutF